MREQAQSRKNLNLLLFLVAAEGGDTNKLKDLLKSGVHVDQQSEKGMTALMAAARLGKADAVEFLLSQGASYSLVDVDGNTALHQYYCANIQSVTALVGAGADIHAKNKEQQTPFLHWVLNRFADREHVNNPFRAPLDDPSNLLAYLIKQGADVFACDKDKTAAAIILENPDCFSLKLRNHIQTMVDHKIISESLPKSGSLGQTRKI